MKYGRFINGILVETFIPPEGVKIEDCFHPDVGFEAIPSDAEVGWTKPVEQAEEVPSE